MATATPVMYQHLAVHRAHVHGSERLWDATALIVLMAGVSLFVMARSALLSIAAGTYSLPGNTTWVAQADFHVRQSQAGLALTVVGLAIGMVAAWMHWRRGRQR